MHILTNRNNCEKNMVSPCINGQWRGGVRGVPAGGGSC